MKYEGRELHWQYCGVAKFDNGMEIYVMDKNFKKYFRNIEKVRELIKKDKESRERNAPIVVNGIGIASEKIEYKIEYRIEKRLVSDFEVVE